MLYTVELGAELQVTHYPSTDYELCYLFKFRIVAETLTLLSGDFRFINSSVVFGAAKSISASDLLLKAYVLVPWCNHQIRQLGLYLALHVLLSEN
jgi:hypothetical protein